MRFNETSPHAERATAVAEAIAEDNLLRVQVDQILVSLSFAKSILTPSEFYNPHENEGLLEDIYGNHFEERFLQDEITPDGIVNDYSIPVLYDTILKEHYPTAEIKHQYSFLLKKLDRSKAIHVLFYFEKMVIMVFKDGKLQIVQTFIYKAPADVVYYLLNISKQFNLESSSITVYGMIEKRSALYEEIHKYFLHIAFAELPPGVNTGEAFMDYPAHFFAHLFYTAL